MKANCLARLLVALSLGAFAASAAADTHPNTEGGVNVNQVFQHGSIDNVNLFNGALTVTVPIGISYPVSPNLSYQLQLVNNSNPWDFWTRWDGTNDGVQWMESAPSHCSNAGLGWRLTFGAIGFGDHELIDSATPEPHSQNVGLDNLFVCGDISSDGNVAELGTAPSSTAYAIYEAPDGSEHLFWNTLHPTDPEDAGDVTGTSTIQNVQYTRDGSYLRLKRYAATTCPAAYNQGTAVCTTIEFPNGNTHVFDTYGRAVRMQDTFGNWVAITYEAAGCPNMGAGDSDCWKISDSLGRAHYIYFTNGYPTYNGSYEPYGPTLSHISMMAAGGGAAPYTFAYTTQTLTRGYPMSDSSLGPVSVPLLTSFTLPDSSSYGVQYCSPTSSPVYCGGSAPDGQVYSGFLKQLTLPTGGSFTYTWQYYAFASGSTRFSYRSSNPGVATRTVYDGRQNATWTYTQTQNIAAGNSETTVVDPLSNQSHHWFSVGGLATPSSYGPSSPTEYDYSRPYDPSTTLSGNNPPNTSDVFLSEQLVDSGGHVQRSTYVRYERDTIGTVGGLDTPPNVSTNNGRMAQQTIVYADGSQASEAMTAGDGGGHYRSVVSSGTFPAGNNARTELHGWNTARQSYNVSNSTNSLTSAYAPLSASQPWLWELKDYDYETENGGTTSSAETYCNDAATGFLKARRIYAASVGLSSVVINPTSSPVALDPVSTNDVITVFTPTPAGSNPGQLASESYYGGDNQAVPSGDQLCSAIGSLVPASAAYTINHSYSYGIENVRQYSGAGFYSRLRTVDPTGLVTADYDTANVQTNYSYDGLGRMIFEVPQGSGAGAGASAETQYLYNANPPKLTVEHLQSGTVLDSTTLDYDGMGRLIEKDVAMPGLTSITKTTYDGLGRKTSESMPYSGVDPNHYTQYLNYDVFDRVGTVVPPDGAGHAVTFGYTGKRQRTRTATVATLPLGAPSREQSATTTENYDRFGRLASIVSPTSVTTTYTYDHESRLTTVSTGTQNRQFAFDPRGFLLSAAFPEANGNASPTIYSSYDARGHYTRRRDGVNDLTFTFDKAERPLLVYSTGALCSAGSSACLKEYHYDGTSDALGKLYQATRYNHMVLGGSSHWDAWTYTYQYLGLDGRISQRNLDHNFDGSSGPSQEHFSQSWTYTPLGDINTENYPNCTAGFSSCAGLSARSVQNLYTDGLLTGVAGFTTGAGITYYANGEISSVTSSNNASGSENVTTSYGADPFGMPRPSSINATSSVAGTLWSTGPYAYDGAGNVMQIGSSGSYTYDLASRLTAAVVQANAIDGVGTVLGTQTYGYDGFDNVTSVGATSTAINTTNNHLTAGNYDNAGSMTSWVDPNPATGGSSSYGYDEFRNLKSFTNTVGGTTESWLYMYDVDDERVWSYQSQGSPSGGRFDRWSLRGLDGKVKRTVELYAFCWNTGSACWTAEPNGWTDSIYRTGLLFVEAPSLTQRRFMSLDHLGSPRLATNGGANETGFHAYYPFGEEFTSRSQDCVSGSCERLKFTGHERDLANPATDAGDLDYMHARYYNPLAGRFLTVDSAAGDAREPASWNRYSYVRGGPMGAVDPLGLEGDTITVTTPPPVDTVGDLSRGSALFNNLVSTLGNWSSSLGSRASQQVGMLQLYYSLFGPKHPAQGLTMLGFALFPELDVLLTAIPEEMTVYQAANEAEETIYAGITNNIKRRAYQQMASKGISIEKVLEVGSRLQARAVEQALIEKAGLSNLLNKINSISVTNPYFEELVAWGEAMLKSVGKW